MPGPEDMLWRAASAVARGRGQVSEARVDVEDHLDRRMFGPDPLSRLASRRTYRVTVTMYVDDLSTDEAPIEDLRRIALTHGIPSRETDPPVHDVHCNVDRRRARTPGMNGCSCSSVPGSGMPSHVTTPGPTFSEKPPAAKPEKSAEEPKDDAMTRFSLLELK